MSKLTKEELIRYSRHLVLQEFGLEAQLKLKEAKVLVVGAGGLGSPALLYLTAAGVGTIGIVDHDDVSLSNLQRQILFTTDDVGKNKSSTAANRLTQLNPEITFHTYANKITSANAESIVSNYDVVLDGTDNFPTRYLLNDICVLLNKTLIYGSILTFEGQVSVFNYLKKDGTYSSNYRDLFPEPPDAESVPNCEQAGVLGVLPGIIGSMQASEVIKVITGIGEPLVDKLALFDALRMELTTITLQNNDTRSSINTLIDYDDFCGISAGKSKSLNTQKNDTMKEITVQELQEMQESGADFQLIDVREPHEYDICNLGGELIPMSQIPHNVDKISRDKKVVVHCRSGKRSGDMVLWLEKNQGFENLYNLKGGILAWANEIDSDMPTY
ncbi:MAG TPA: molybdopterin-synthase adenylyltransferase MoeB [Cyclobacteriaceae bacterium]|nr:molybdopterin-synthase adenylyltransferase MoeB [Cyclobacteriaceae bacterium]